MATAEALLALHCSAKDLMQLRTRNITNRKGVNLSQVTNVTVMIVKPLIGVVLVAPDITGNLAQLLIH